MVEVFAGYKSLFSQDIHGGASRAYAPGKFFDLHVANQNPMAAEILRRIAELSVVGDRGC